MNEEVRRDGDSSDGKGNKKTVLWPDYFAWMVKIAEKHVGKNDAKDVANAALYDFCCSDRPRPASDDRQGTEYLLRYLVKQRARALLKKQKRHFPEVLSSFDQDEPILEFDEANAGGDVFDRLEVERALRSLSMVERGLVTGYYVDGFTAQELAQRYQMKPNTVDSRIRRTLPKMAETLTKHSRRPRSSSGLMLFLTWKEEQSQRLRSMWTTLHDGISEVTNWIRLGRCFAYCAPLAALPGHALGYEFPARASADPNGVQIESQVDLVSRNAVVNFEPIAPPSNDVAVKKSKFSSPTNVLSKPVAPVVVANPVVVDVVGPNEVVHRLAEPPPVNDCQNQLGVALAKKNEGQFEDCLEVLRRVRLRDTACGQTSDWKLLNTACRNP